MVALALKKSISAKWNGIPIRCAEVTPEVVNGSKLGVTVVHGALRGFEL